MNGEKNKNSVTQSRDSNGTKVTNGYQAKGRGGSQKSPGLDYMSLTGCGPGLDLWSHGKERHEKICIFGRVSWLQW